MRILFISGSFPPIKCGVGDYTAILTRNLGMREGMKVAVLTSVGARKVELESNIEVIPVIKKWDFFSIAKIVEEVRKWQPDLVHIQFPTMGYRGLMPNLMPIIFKLLKVPVVQTWHEPPVFVYLFNAITRDRVVVVERDFKSYVRPRYRWLVDTRFLKFIPIASSIPKAKLSETDRHAIRKKFNSLSTNLIAYFGFVSPSKGVEAIFDIADPAQDRLVLICDLDHTNPYHKTLLEHTNQEPWAGKVFVTGFLCVEEVGQILAAADAAVFPFINGASMRNTSLLAAKAQGTFILTTHRDRRGYDIHDNVYYSALGDIPTMRKALRSNIGVKNVDSTIQSIGWDLIADEHIKLYNEVLKKHFG